MTTASVSAIAAAISAAAIVVAAVTWLVKQSSAAIRRAAREATVESFAGVERKFVLLADREMRGVILSAALMLGVVLLFFAHLITGHGSRRRGRRAR
jgi:hypothetical protein